MGTCLKMSSLMHQSFVTTAQPLGRAADSRANVSCFYLCTVTIVRGKCQGFEISRKTGQCNVKHDCRENCHSFYSWLSSQCGTAGEKSKPSLYPGAGGCGYK